MKILSMKTSLSSSQKPNKLALQPIKTCKTFEHFQLGYTAICIKKILPANSVGKQAQHELKKLRNECLLTDPLGLVRNSHFRGTEFLLSIPQLLPVSLEETFEQRSSRCN